MREQSARARLPRAAGREAFLHFGIHKTGTSSIQKALHARRADLLKLGILYPAFNANHYDFYSCFCSQPLKYHMVRARGIRNDIEMAALRDKVLRGFERELQESAATKLIVSSEDLSSMTTGELRDFIAYLRAQGFETIRVLIYLRDYISYWESIVQQKIKGGSYIDLAREARELTCFKFYTNIAQTVSACEGVSELILRVFHPEHLVEGDVVKDFAIQAGIEELNLNSERVNESLSLRSALALSEINRVLPRFVQGGTNVLYEALLKSIRELGGEKLRADAATSAAIFRKSKKDRARLSEGWFAGADPLGDIMQARMERDAAQGGTIDLQASAQDIYEVLIGLILAAQTDAIQQRAQRLRVAGAIAKLQNDPGKEDAAKKASALLLARLKAAVGD